MANVSLVRNGILFSIGPPNGLQGYSPRSHYARNPTRLERFALDSYFALCLRRSVGAI